jgi:hypothetical protein
MEEDSFMRNSEIYAFFVYKHRIRFFVKGIYCESFLQYSCEEEERERWAAGVEG